MPVKRFGTWNMQGASGASGPKWPVALEIFDTNNLDALCLQECGIPPADNNSTGHKDFLKLNTITQTFESRGINVYVSSAARAAGHKRDSDGKLVADSRISLNYVKWKTKAAPSKQYSLFYFNWDVVGGRVNYAILVKSDIISANIGDATLPILQGREKGRPAIGVRTIAFDIYSIHDNSGSGAETAYMLDNIKQQIPRNPTYLFGDFNKPFALGLSYHTFAAINPGGNTHSTRAPKPTSKLDYCYTNAPEGCKGTVKTAYKQSDHFPVVFKAT